MPRQINRRAFIADSAALGAGFWIAGRQTGYGQEKSPNAKLNIACIGCGGQAASDMKSVSTEIAPASTVLSSTNFVLTAVVMLASST